MLEKFRRDPKAHPLKTPSGKIEIFSETVASFDYTDCGGHPQWYDRNEWLGAPSPEYPPPSGIESTQAQAAQSVRSW